MSGLRARQAKRWSVSGRGLGFAAAVGVVTAALVVGVVGVIALPAAATAFAAKSWRSQAKTICQKTTDDLYALTRPPSLLAAPGSELSADDEVSIHDFLDATAELKAANAKSLDRLRVAKPERSKFQSMTDSLAAEAVSYQSAADAVSAGDADTFLDELTIAASERDAALRSAHKIGLVPCARLGGFGRPSDASYTDLNSGERFDNVCADETLSAAVSCDAPHGGELFGGFILEGDGLAFPGDDALLEESVPRCVDQFASYVGIDTDSSIFHVKVGTPNETAWAQRDYSVLCMLVRDDENLIIGSAFKENR